MLNILLPICDFANDSSSDDDDASITETESVSDAGGSPSNAPNDYRPSALRSRATLPLQEDRAPAAAAASPVADGPRCRALIHPSCQSDAGVAELEAALADLDGELRRTAERRPPVKYPRPVPPRAFCFFSQWMRRMQQRAAAADQRADAEAERLAERAAR